MELPYEPAILGTYPKKHETWNTNSKEYVHSCVYCSIISNSQGLELVYFLKLGVSTTVFLNILAYNTVLVILVLGVPYSDLTFLYLKMWSLILVIICHHVNLSQYDWLYSPSPFPLLPNPSLLVNILLGSVYMTLFLFYFVW